MAERLEKGGWWLFVAIPWLLCLLFVSALFQWLASFGILIAWMSFLAMGVILVGPCVDRAQRRNFILQAGLISVILAPICWWCPWVAQGCAIVLICGLLRSLLCEGLVDWCHHLTELLRVRCPNALPIANRLIRPYTIHALANRWPLPNKSYLVLAEMAKENEAQEKQVLKAFKEAFFCLAVRPSKRFPEYHGLLLNVLLQCDFLRYHLRREFNFLHHVCDAYFLGMAANGEVSRLSKWPTLIRVLFRDDIVYYKREGMRGVTLFWFLSSVLSGKEWQESEAGVEHLLSAVSHALAELIRRRASGKLPEERNGVSAADLRSLLLRLTNLFPASLPPHRLRLRLTLIRDAGWLPQLDALLLSLPQSHPAKRPAQSLRDQLYSSRP